MEETICCEHWIELDDERGCFEYCRGKRKKCTCAGIKYQCDYPEFFKEDR